MPRANATKPPTDKPEGGDSKPPLPAGWCWVTLRDIAQISGGITKGQKRRYSDEVRMVPYLRVANVQRGYFDLSEVKEIEATEAEIEALRLQPGDILFNEGGDRDKLGRGWVWNGELPECVHQNHVFRARVLDPGISPKFISFYANSEGQRYFMENATQTTNLASINLTKLGALPIPLPPAAEQSRIVAELEKHLTRLDAGITALRKIQANLKCYRAAVLKAATEGRLVPTESELAHAEGRPFESGQQLLARILTERRQTWQGRGEYKEPVCASSTGQKSEALMKGWTRSTIAQVSFLDVGFAFKSAEFEKSGIRLLRGENLEPGKMRWADTRYWPESKLNRVSHLLIREGEIVLAMDRPLISSGLKIARARAQDLPCLLVQRVARLRPVDEAMTAFLFISMNTHGFIKHLLDGQTGTQLPHINGEGIQSFEFLLPPIAEQIRIVAEVERCLSVVDGLEAVVAANIHRADGLQNSLFKQAFAGNLGSSTRDEEPVDLLLERIKQTISDVAISGKKRVKSTNDESRPMKAPPNFRSALADILSERPDEPSAWALFKAGHFDRDQVLGFYDSIADSAEAIKFFATTDARPKPKRRRKKTSEVRQVPFRLHELWVKQFKNLEDYTVRFEPEHALDVLLGWNGTGKSNLFEVLIAIFRDLYFWQSRNRWRSQEGLTGFRIRYEISGVLFDVVWDEIAPRPEIRKATDYSRSAASSAHFLKCKREELQLPNFVFGYYSGPSNRFADLFAEAKQIHYERLLKEKADDDETLARLLTERRFFNAETHHAKYALLSFFYQDDPGIEHFLKKHLRIEALESVLFVFKRPRWWKNNRPSDFWGADGLLRPVLERIRRHSIASMVLPQTVDEGFQSTTQDHYFMLLPTKQHLQALAGEYGDPTSFFVALESADFSSIIHDVRIRIRIKATSDKETVITFKEMSEGEQQLLMVLGLLRFTKMNQSLVLLDEPDTHLNPHWQLGYLHLLLEALVGDESEIKAGTRVPIEELEKRLTSQVLLSTHDPLAVAGLLKENIHLLKRRAVTEECEAVSPTDDPRGMGFTGILTSDMFGLRSDLDDETLCLLDKHAELAGQEKLSAAEKTELKILTSEVERLGFKSASSDPYYRLYLQALMRRRKTRGILRKSTWTVADMKTLSEETDDILKELENAEGEK